MSSNRHPHVRDTIDLTIEPEAAPLLEPATEAQEGAAAAQAGAVEEASGDSSSDSWELVNVAAPSSSSLPSVATRVSQERNVQACGDLHFGQALRTRRLFEPVLQIPFIPQLVHCHWRFYIVGYPGSFRLEWSAFQLRRFLLYTDQAPRGCSITALAGDRSLQEDPVVSGS